MVQRRNLERKIRRVTGIMNYPNYEELNPGDLIVEGIYIGETVSKKFGTPQHEFRSDDGAKGHWTITGGHLNYLADKFLTPGTWCQVYFEGYDTVSSGRFAGKEFKQFSLGLADDNVETVVEREDIGREAKPSSDDSLTPWEDDSSGEEEEGFEIEDDEQEKKVEVRRVGKKKSSKPVVKKVKKSAPKPIKYEAEDSSDDEDDDDGMFDPGE